MSALDVTRDFLVATDVIRALDLVEQVIASDTVEAPDDVLNLCSAATALRRVKQTLAPDPFETPGEVVPFPGFSMKVV